MEFSIFCVTVYSTADEEVDNLNIAISPPIENAHVNTDCDSDKSDDENTCNPDHLPRRILLASVIPNTGEDRVDNRNDYNIPDSQPSTSTAPSRVTATKKSMKNVSSKKRKPQSAASRPSPSKIRKTDYSWHKNKVRAKSSIPSRNSISSPNLDEKKNVIKNPLDSINEFWTPEWIEDLCYQSKQYALQKSYPCDQVTPNNMRVFLSILVLSGYNKLPSRRMYWSLSADVSNQLVSDCMRRDTFDQIMKCLHFADNMKITDDRFYKVCIAINFSFDSHKIHGPLFVMKLYSS